ncbi:MAG: ABC transporter permease [Deltaproteobacteria bacterium]|nr:ABC transporter permease [Deltaproteobacteria bacterium]
MQEFLLTSFQQGLLISLAVMGIYISFRILDFPDLTCDGSFSLGGGLVAVLLGASVNPYLALAFVMGAGFLAGCCTGLLNARFKINPLLSGILMMTMLYSINLRIMNRPNYPLFNLDTILKPVESMTSHSQLGLVILFGLMVVIFKALLDLFLKTELGLVLISSGDNETMTQGLGFNTGRVKILGMGLSNALIAVSGAMTAQYYGFADISIGVGIIIVGIAAIIIGESLFRPSRVPSHTRAIILGTIIYYMIVSIGLRLGLAPTDLKVATALMVIGVLIFRLRRSADD